jgi:hypothetical protein
MGEGYVCRSCGSAALQTVIDLGVQPLANSYIRPEHLMRMEPHHPLLVLRCTQCHLVQVPPVVHEGEIFSDYLYFSSFSRSWLDHAARYCVMIIPRLRLNANSFVVEIASNDGYLLQNMVRAGIPCLGVDPAENVAKAAREKGVPTEVAFFGRETAQRLAGQGRKADLIAANNVMAHVPELNDFIAGLSILLKSDGVITVEFPHLKNLVEQNQFDTIYHEHYSYFSLIAVDAAFRRHGLVIFDVDQIPTHGGSLRIYAAHASANRTITPAVIALLSEERAAGYERPEIYARFAERVVETKSRLLEFLMNARREGKRVVAYGAPAKGNTLLNFCGARSEYIAFTVDASPHKQNHYLPGTRIPIRAPDAIRASKPDYVLILPWNLKDEIESQMADVRGWGGKFVVPIPELAIF